MANDFQKWMIEQGYTREFYPFGAWQKNGETVSGYELNQKLNEYKSLKQ